MPIGLRGQRLVERFSKIFVCVALLLTVPVVASAHAKLVRSQPNANETLSTVPRIIELWFSELLEPGLNKIEVKDQAGNRVDSSDVTLAENNKKALVNLKQLSAGVYTVRWKVLSADQHAIRGVFDFTVTESAIDSSTLTPSPSQEIATPTAAPHETAPINETEDYVSWRQTLVRWLSYLAMMTLFGGIAFRLMVLAPAMKRVGGSLENKLLRAATRRVLSVTLVAALSLLLTSIVALILQAADVFDTSLLATLSPEVLIRVLRTGYGPSWILQVASLVVLLILLILLRTKRSSFLWRMGLVAGALLLAAPSWTGHAMLAAEHFRLAVMTDWLHLLAGSFWVGGIFHLALTWKPISSLVPHGRRATLLHQVITSFTRVAMPSVVLLVLAGLYNTWAHVPSFRALWVTPFGQALALKLLLVLLMLVLGAINNYYFGKRAARLVGQDKPTDSETHLERGFVRSIRFEAALGIVVLLVTAVLVFLTPARSHPDMGQRDQNEKWNVVVSIGGAKS